MSNKRTKKITFLDDLEVYNAVSSMELFTLASVVFSLPVRS